MDYTKRMVDIRIPNKVLQGYSFFIHVPDAGLVAVVTYAKVSKEFKVF